MTSVLNTTNKKCEITSMKSTFESCTSLSNVIINNLNIENLKSMHKLFYKSTINDYSFIDCSSNNLEDISYMFAYSEIEFFEVKGLNFANVKNM